jgi:hypothetical protein
MVILKSSYGSNLKVVMVLLLGAFKLSALMSGSFAAASMGNMGFMSNI